MKTDNTRRYSTTYGLGGALDTVDAAVEQVRKAGAEPWEAEVTRRALRHAVAANYGDDTRADEEMRALLDALCKTPNRGLARLYRMPEVYAQLRRAIVPAADRLTRVETPPSN